jgi:hypothetical protein
LANNILSLLALTSTGAEITIIIENIANDNYSSLTKGNFVSAVPIVLLLSTSITLLLPVVVWENALLFGVDIIIIIIDSSSMKSETIT